MEGGAFRFFFEKRERERETYRIAYLTPAMIDSPSCRIEARSNFFVRLLCDFK